MTGQKQIPYFNPWTGAWLEVRMHVLEAYITFYFWFLFRSILVSLLLEACITFYFCFTFQSMLVSLLTYHSKRTDISEEILTCLLTYTDSLYKRILRNESMELWSSKFGKIMIWIFQEISSINNYRWYLSQECKWWNQCHIQTCLKRYGRPRKRAQKSFFNIFSMYISYVKNKWNSLQILQKKIFLQETIMLPYDIVDYRIFSDLQSSPWDGFGCCQNIHAITLTKLLCPKTHW